jgi:pyruvate-formate lyase-activating enzyme
LFAYIKVIYSKLLLETPEERLFEMTKVDTIDWNTIGKCNLRCLHCYGPDKRLKALPLETMLAMADRMADMKVVRVVLTGGEPLITPGIERILERLSSHQIEIALSTNGTFVDAKWDAIAECVNSLNIPLDGHTPALHAQSRMDTSTFHTNMAVLARYKNSPGNRPKKLRVGTVYSKATQGHLQSIARRLLPFSEVITTWKLYELIDHEMQPELRAPILHERGSFEEEVKILMDSPDLAPLHGKIMAASASSRNMAYFMINPQGLVVVPTQIDGRSIEKVIGHFVKDPIEDLLFQWSLCVNPTNYHRNHDLHYAKT